MASCVVQQIRETWRSLDVALHPIAFAPNQNLQGRLVDSSDEDFEVAIDIRCRSFIRMAPHAEPWMHDGGTLLATSYHSSDTLGRQPTSTTAQHHDAMHFEIWEGQ